nr:hypothetical protein [Sphingomonas sp. 66-10]
MAAGADLAVVDRPFDLATATLDQTVNTVEIGDDAWIEPVDADRAKGRPERPARRIKDGPIAGYRPRPFRAGEEPRSRLPCALDRLRACAMLPPDSQ